MADQGSKASIAELQEQVRRIQAEIETRKKSVKGELRAEIEEMLKEEELTILDVYPEFARKGARAAPEKIRARPEVAAKYKDPESGATWAGRGRSPKWVNDVMEKRGINIQQFKALPDYQIG